LEPWSAQHDCGITDERPSLPTVSRVNGKRHTGTQYNRGHQQSGTFHLRNLWLIALPGPEPCCIPVRPSRGLHARWTDCRETSGLLPARLCRFSWTHPVVAAAKINIGLELRRLRRTVKLPQSLIDRIGLRRASRTWKTTAFS